MKVAIYTDKQSAKQDKKSWLLCVYRCHTKKDTKHAKRITQYEHSASAFDDIREMIGVSMSQ